MEESKFDSNEINLHELWTVIAKNKKRILILFFMTIIVAAIVSLLLPKGYRGEAILLIQGPSGVTVKDISEFIGSIDNEKISKMLPKTHYSITGIKLDQFKEKDTKDKIIAVIDAKDINSIRPALNELIEYIKSIELIKINIKEEQERLAKRSAELGIIIDASSGLLSDYRQMLKAGKLVPLGFNPVDLNRKIADIKLEKFQAEQSMRRLQGGIEIAEQVYIGDGPVKPNKKQIVVVSGMLSLFVGIIWAFIRESTRNT